MLFNVIFCFFFFSLADFSSDVTLRFIVYKKHVLLYVTMYK